MTAERDVDTIPSSDLPLHRWDLAKATGQDAAEGFGRLDWVLAQLG